MLLPTNKCSFRQLKHHVHMLLACKTFSSSFKIYSRRPIIVIYVEINIFETNISNAFTT